MLRWTNDKLSFLGYRTFFKLINIQTYTCHAVMSTLKKRLNVVLQQRILEDIVMFFFYLFQCTFGLWKHSGTVTWDKVELQQLQLKRKRSPTELTYISNKCVHWVLIRSAVNKAMCSTSVFIGLSATILLSSVE